MSVGDLSTLLVWGAATALTVSLVASSWELARIAEVAARAPRRAPVAVAAGGAGVGAAGGAGAVATAGSGEPDGPGSTAAPEAPGPAVDPRAAARAREARARGIARSTMALGTLLLLVAIVLRGVAAGRWPTANMYEFTLVGTFVALVALQVVDRRRRLPFVAVVVTAVALLALVLAVHTLYVRADAVQPALQRYWLVIHVGVAVAATGIFTVGAATSALQLMQDSRGTATAAQRRSWLTGPRMRWLEQVPGPVELEATAFRLNAVGFVLWTFTLISGAIWAEESWGRYWGWDPKEIGTFVAWVAYAAYLHARTTRGWSGRRAAWLSLLAYAAVLANFTLVNLFTEGKHSYDGL